MWTTNFKIDEKLYSDIPTLKGIEEGIDGVVYWINIDPNEDIYCQGYVGVTKDFKSRMNSHKQGHYLKKPLQSKIKHYKWENLNKVIIFKGPLTKCLQIENVLRPSEFIGWNLCRGGGYPPLRTYSDRCISARKAAKTRRASGFYNFEESQKRNLKVYKSKLKNGYFQSNRHRESHRNSRLSIMKNNEEYNREVVRLDKDNNILDRFESYYALATFLQIHASHVKRVIDKKRKSVKGYKLKLKEEVSEDLQHYKLHKTIWQK